MSIARNPLNYHGIGIPAGYRRPSNPYYVNTGRPVALSVITRALAPAGARAKLEMTVLSTTLADFDAKALLLPLMIGGTFTKTFDDDAAPPSTATVIKIMGLTTVAQIAAEIVASCNIAGVGHFPAVDHGDGSLTIYQPFGGDSGNGELEFTGDLTGELSVNGQTDLVGMDVYFYGGNSVDVPLLWGPMRGMGPTTPNNLRFSVAPA